MAEIQYSEIEQSTPSFRHLCTISIDAGHQGVRVGSTPKGLRRIGVIHGGTVTGPLISGRMALGGGDWALVSSDDCIHIDFRGVIETDDGSGIYVTQIGRLHAPAEIRPLLMDRARWSELHDKSYYFRTGVTFEAADEKYDWLNRVVGVGMGTHAPNQVRYKLFELR